MIKKIILSIFIFLLTFSNNLSAAFSTSSSNVVNITLEFKLEDENKKDLNINLKAVWKNEK